MAPSDAASAPRLDIPVLILAGGLASRMGGADKALLTLGGRRVLERVLERLESQTTTILLNANEDAGRFAVYALPVIPDGVDDRPGPLAGVLAGLDWAAEHGIDEIVTIAADTPFFPFDLVARLKRAANEQVMPIALAASRDENGAPRRHPTFGLWPVSVREDLRAQLASGQRRVAAFADRHGAATALFDHYGGDPFFNVNTPQDLADAEARLSAQNS